MSWREQDNFIVESAENPEPEEDSDLPVRLWQNVEEMELRTEEEGPEDDLGMTHQVSIASSHSDFISHNSPATAGTNELNHDTYVENDSIREEAHEPSVSEDGGPNVNRDNESLNVVKEGAAEDSFEQDEETAAPECENNVKHETCSESDGQLIHNNIISSNLELNDSYLYQSFGEKKLTDNIELDNHANEENIQLREQSCSDNLTLSQSSENYLDSFKGNIEILNNLEDAPEAEIAGITNIMVMGPLEEEDNMNIHIALLSSVNSHCSQNTLSVSVVTDLNHLQAGSVPDKPFNIPLDDRTDQEQIISDGLDLQIPECDRDTACQQILQSGNDSSAFKQATEVSVFCQEETCDKNYDSTQIVTSSESKTNLLKSENIMLSPAQELPEKISTPASSEVLNINSSVAQTGSVSAFLSTSNEDCSNPNHSLDSSYHLPVLISSHQDISAESGQPALEYRSKNQVIIAQPISPPISISTHMNENPSTTITDNKRCLAADDTISLSLSKTQYKSSSLENFVLPSSSHSSTSNSSNHSSPARAASCQSLNMDTSHFHRELALLESDDEDELLHELDAELLARPKIRSSQSSLAQRLMSGEIRPSLNGLQAFDIRQLQALNRQLLEQLKIRDEEINRLKSDREMQRMEIAQLHMKFNESENTIIVSPSPCADDLYLPQIKELENTITQQENELKALREKLANHDVAAKRAVTTLQNELKARVDQVTKMYEECLKEKHMTVVKFAESENKYMEAKRIIDRGEAKIKEMLKDKESMMAAVKTAKSDKQRLVVSFETKCTEISNLNKEFEKMKEAVSSSEYRIKWFQNKLKDELEQHKETKVNLEKTSAKLKEAREETEVIRKECQAIVKRYQESEEIKSNSLDKELKIKETELRTQMQEKNDTEEIHQMTKRELDSLKAQHKDVLEEAKTLKDKVHCLEDERQQNHRMIENYQEIMQRQKTDNAGLKSQISSLTTLEEDYKRAQDMIQALDKDINDLKIVNRDLQKDMESCRERESKMLTLQSELSRSNALLRSENSNLSNKASTLSTEVEQLKMQLQELDTTVKNLTEKYHFEKSKKQEELDRMSASLAEQIKECSDYKQKWEDEMDNSKTLKRRHANNIKDLTRQLQQVRRKLESQEGKGDACSMGSRTNSNGSLNSVDNSQHSQTAHQAPVQEFRVITEQVEVDKQVLIERIVRLQKAHARKNEKLEFLGEHIQQLLEEIKKKNKIIQTYVLREDAGTLSSEEMDSNKERVNAIYKAEVQKEIQTLLARKGGIMASVYSVHQQDGTLTLDLSLQINKKLQAVLEDTLLKNITLKENLDTLGEEIARLSQENRRLQLHLQEIERRTQLVAA